jgi:hypothetical protein
MILCIIITIFSANQNTKMRLMSAYAGKNGHVFRAGVPNGQYNPKMSKTEYRDMNRVLQVTATINLNNKPKLNP